MNINVFTLVVQIINFLVLVFILNKLIYKPLIKLMKDRRNYIKSSIDNAENKLKEAEEIKEKYKKELDQIENYKKEQIEKIDSEIFDHKTDEIVKVKEEIEEKKKEFLDQLEIEKNIIIDNMIKKFCFSVDELLNNIFSSLTNSSLNNVILKKFVNEITNLSDDNIEKINRSNTKIIDFVSSFEITQEDKNYIIESFKKSGISFNDINFITDNNMILGNKIVVDGLVINSNIQNIIDQFTTNLKKIV